jgi:hypothetical protein
MAGILALKAAAVFAFVYFGWIYGERLGNGRSAPGRFLIGVLILLAWQSLWQTFFYYIGLPLGSLTDAAALALSVVCLGPLVIRTHVKAPEGADVASPDWRWMLLCVIPALLAGTYIVRGAWLAGTPDALRTPWPLLPIPTLGAFAIIGAAGLLAAWKTRTAWVSGLIAIIGLASLMAITPLVYQSGFGFDGFLHRASMQVMATTGTLNPKPPYYIGLYVFETWASRLLSISITLIDHWLMVLAIGLVPLSLLWIDKNRKHTAWIAAASLLAIPLAPFVTTTPQAIAYVLGFVTVAAAIGKLHPLATMTFGLWALSVHPLAGLPFLLVAMAVMCKERIWLSVLFSIAAAVSVPAAFFLLGSLSSNQVIWDFSRLLNAETFNAILSRLQPPANRVALWADAAALLEILQIPLLLIMSMVAIKKDADNRRLWLIVFTSGILLAISGLVLQAAGDFPFLIDYERGNYADRLFVIARLLWILPGLAGFDLAIDRLKNMGLAPAVFLLAMIPAGIAANIYVALPRYDAASASHGWSVGQADTDAVRWIERNASGSNYTVLANQSVSAAAVQELGFKRYAGDVFFYPIPTGGALYQQFLKSMDVDSNLDPIREASKLGQTRLVYVVLNDYWWDASRVAQNLSRLTDAQESFSNEKVRVYRFEIN